MDDKYFFIEIMLVVSVSGSFLFVFTKIFTNICLKGYEVKYEYFLFRVLVIFFLFPAMALSYVIIKNSVKIYQLQIVSDDFVQMKVSDTKFLLFSDEIIGYILLIFAVWLIGAVLNCGIRILRERVVIKRIMEYSEECKEDSINEVRNNLVWELNVRKEIKIYRNEIIASPFSIGILEPKIILPPMKFNEEDLYFILKHEIIHCKRVDILYRIFMVVIRGLHWYNPVLSYFEKDFFNFSEIACDEAVIKDCDLNVRSQYAELILCMLESEQTNINITGFSNREEKYMKRRITHIMRGKKKIRKGIVVLSTALFIFMCPMVTYASIVNISNVKNHLTDGLENMYSVVDGYNNEFIEYEEDLSIETGESKERKNFFLITRGNKNVDVTIAGNGEAQFHEVALNKGASIRVTLSSDSAKDSFRAGIVNLKDGKRRYVESIEGSVAYTFSINEKAEYAVYITGQNGKTGKNLNIIGRIAVTY